MTIQSERRRRGPLSLPEMREVRSLLCDAVNQQRLDKLSEGSISAWADILAAFEPLASESCVQTGQRTWLEWLREPDEYA